MNGMSKLESFVSVREAAEMLGLPRWKIWKAIKARQINAYHFVNKRILVRVSEIVQLIETSSPVRHAPDESNMPSKPEI
jgi:excisionase family DNA binding protein